MKKRESGSSTEGIPSRIPTPLPIMLMMKNAVSARTRLAIVHESVPAVPVSCATMGTEMFVPAMTMEDGIWGRIV
jgi:hypothetical protein